MPARDVAVVTPWYPTRQLPFRGSFVRAMVEATAPLCEKISVYHCDAWAARLQPSHESAIIRAQSALLPVAVREGSAVGGAALHYLPVPMQSGLPFGELATRHRDALSEAVGGPIEASVVHAHVPIPSGWAAMHVLRPDSRLFLTEHASFLDRILAEPESRSMYDQILDRCEALFAVGQGIRSLLYEAFPHHAHRIHIVPNPISFEVQRSQPVTKLTRWLYVGGLLRLKGVNWLLEAFAVCRAEDPELTLTFVGDGEMGAALKARSAELNLQDAVTFTGAVPPEEAQRLMREHDLLVHPSRHETFGMTIVEASAAGLPVLVTRCGGPEQTLAGIEEAAGELVEVEESEASLVAGYRRLRDRFPSGVDLELARRVLNDRYGYPAVARAHHRFWFPDDEEANPARPEAPSVQ